MKERQKTVYYCDFCKKYRLTRPSMMQHESSCTLNPDRVCRVQGCKGDCPWCKFSAFRLGKEFEEGISIDVDNIHQDMQAWWAKKGNQWVMSAYDEDAYGAIYQ